MPSYKRSCNLSNRQLKRRFNNVIINPTSDFTVTENELEPLEQSVELNDPDGSMISEDFFLSEISFSETESINNNTIENDVMDIHSFLVNWKQAHNVNNNAMNALLDYLKSNAYPSLPKDCRTLMRTPKSRIVVAVEPGYYVHIGLKLALDAILCKNKDIREFELDFNIDGVPISRSSTSSFWLILGKAFNLPEHSVFVIGVYHGYNKPSNFNEFLRMHVNELKNLITEYKYENIPIKIKVRAYICDTPARASVLGTKSHNAYFGCNKCTQEGYYTNSRMTFPDTNSALRTNQSFRNKCDENYHKYDTIIEELGIDMVRQFPLDYLHTVCLGVVKKLIRMWLSGSTASLLSSLTVKRISEKLKTISGTQPKEFQRRIRPLSDFGYFKGSELRTFVLYAGVFALKDEITKEMYDNFLLLHIGILILCDKEKFRTHSELASELLKTFVEDFAELYGKYHIVYNVHCLTHLVTDTQYLGCLDSFSSFPFESYMYQIKRLLHKKNQPLPELCNRLLEQNYSNFLKTKNICSTEPILKKNKNIRTNTGLKEIYKEVIFKYFTINDTKKNKWILTKKKNIICFEYIEKIRNKFYIFGSEIRNKKDFYSVPVASNNFDIYETDGIKDSARLWNLNQVARKLFLMETLNGKMFVVVTTKEKGETYVQAISTTFLVDQSDGSKKYFYPKKSSKIRKAIMERWIPNEIDFYEIPNFEIISKNFETYLEALDKEKQRSIYFNTESELEDSARKAEKRKHPGSEIQKDFNYLLPKEKPLNINEKVMEMKDNEICISNSPNQIILEKPYTPIPIYGTPKSIHALKEPTSIISSNITPCSPAFSQFSIISTGKNEKPSPSMDLEKKIIVLEQKMDNIEAQNRIIIDLLQSMVNSTNSKTIILDPSFESPKWPLKRAKQIKRLNEELLNKEFRDQVFLNLSRCHNLLGTNIRGSVKKIMEKMFAYKALIKFSWSGKISITSNDTAKLIFSEMEAIINIIFDLAGRRDDHKAIENEIKYFMKRVPQRYNEEISKKNKENKF